MLKTGTGREGNSLFIHVKTAERGEKYVQELDTDVCKVPTCLQIRRDINIQSAHVKSNDRTRPLLFVTYLTSLSAILDDIATKVCTTVNSDSVRTRMGTTVANSITFPKFAWRD